MPTTIYKSRKVKRVSKNKRICATSILLNRDEENINRQLTKEEKAFLLKEVRAEAKANKHVVAEVILLEPYPDTRYGDDDTCTWDGKSFFRSVIYKIQAGEKKC